MKNLLPFLFCLMPFMAPDDGGAGGGAPPTLADISEWIKRMDAAEKKDRPSVVGEMAKALGIPIPEVWKRLKEAGWNANKPSGNTPPKNDKPDGNAKPNVAKQAVTIRHKTPHPRYRRAGLVLTDQFKPYEVTADQLEALKKDSWVEIKEGGL